MERLEILIVDDKPENLLSLEYILEEEVFSIVKAGSGEEALSLTLDHDFFLILMDVQMPGMNGYDTASLLRGSRKTKDIPIIFLTANNQSEENMFMGYEAGAVDYLFKPIDTRILLSKVRIFETLYRQKQELDNRVRQLTELHKQLELLSNLDGLTGVFNRRYMDSCLEDEWARAVRLRTPLSLLMIDIDYFKLFNDTYGHPAGDKCLIEVSSALSSVLHRHEDRVARYGGEEFAAILPNTGGEAASAIAEAMRSAVEDLGIPHESSSVGPHVTVSIGCCTHVPLPEDSAAVLLKTSDDALYQSKIGGRNRVKVLAYGSTE